MAKNSLDVIVNVSMNGSEALNEISKLKGSVTGVGEGVSSEMNKASQSVNNTGTAFTGLSGKVRAFSESFSGLNGVMSSVLGAVGINSLKSMTLDMGMAREQSRALMSVVLQGKGSFQEAQKAADELYNVIKEGTSESVVKNQMMIDAMNGIRMSTGASKDELESLVPIIQKVGEASILMGDDTEHATFVMKEAMSGLNGDFTVLKEQFGITADKMKAAGWSGAASDVKGYQAALEECFSSMGDMSQVMDTTTGKISKIQSQFNKTGREIGESMMPAVDWLATKFLEANSDGNILSKTILYLGGATSVFASVAPTLKPMFETYDSIKGAVDKAKNATELLTSATEVMDGVTAALTGTKVAETAAETAETAAETANAGAKGVNAAATQVETGEHVGLAAAMGAAASSAWALTTALLRNPWTWVAVAVIALVAIMWHLYNTNEDFRNGVNNLINTLKGGLIAAWNAIVSTVQQVWAGMQKLGQIIWSLLVPAWNQLMQSLAPLRNALVKLYGTFQTLWNTLSNTGVIDGGSNSFSLFGITAQAAGALIVGVVEKIIVAVQLVLAVVVPVITFIVNQLSVFINAASGVIGVISALIQGNISLGQAFNLIGGIIQAATGQILKNMMQLVVDIVDNLGGVFSSLPGVIQTELGNIANAILNSDPILSAIVGLAGQIIDFFKSVLGIASPGHMAQAIQEEMGHIAEFISGAIGSIVGAIVNLGMSIWNGFTSALGNLGMIIQLKLLEAQTIAVTLVGTFVNMVVQRFMSILNGVLNIFSLVTTAISTRLNQARAVAGTLANAIRNAIVTRFNLLVARVRQFFQNIVTHIRSRLSSAAGAARSQAVAIYNAIVSKVQQIPGKIGQEVGKLKDIIRDKLVAAAKQMFSSAQSLVSNFLNGIQAHSPGKIQRTWFSEMSSLATIASSKGVTAAKATGNAAKNIVNAWTNNMETLGIETDTSQLMSSKDILKQSIPLMRQFDVYNPAVIGSNMTSTSNSQGITNSSNSTVNNDDHTVVYNIDQVTFDCNNLEGNGKEMFYNILEELYPGGV